MQKTTRSEMATDDPLRRRMNVFRFGLLAIPPVAWALYFGPLFMVSRGAGLDWVSIALIPSLIEIVVVAIICAVAWYGYKQLVVKR